MKKLYGLALALMFVTILAGCAILDSLSGINPLGEDTGPGPLDSILRTVESVPGGYGGIASGILGALAIYKTIRTRQLGKKKVQFEEAATLVIAGIDNALKNGKRAKISKDELYSAVNDLKAQSKNPLFLTELVAAVKETNRKSPDKPKA